MGLALLLVLGLPIGLALLRWLEPVQKFSSTILLAPMTGLLCLMLIIASSVLLFDGFTLSACFFLILITEVFSIRLLLKTPFEFAIDDLFLKQRMTRISIALVVILSLFPIYLFKVPNGVDWIGFSSLTNLYATTGSTQIPSPNIGYWTYPPAFPATAALLQVVLNVPASDAVHLLGRISLMFILLALMGLAQRWNAGVETLIAIALGFGLFVKVHDSGYPTLVSQFIVIMGFLIITSEKKNRIILGLLILFGGLIHPSGSLILAALVLSEIILNKYNQGAFRKEDKILLGFIIIAVLLTLILSPEGIAVQSEYGWQGGSPLILFAGPLLLALAAWSSWQFKEQEISRLLSTWILILWLMTFIHFLAGFESFSVLSLISLSLYSMGVYAFHIPFALAAGILLAQIPEKKELPQYLPRTATILAFTFLLIGQSALILLSSHQEMLIKNNGDDAIIEHLESLPEGTIIYTEQAHWGFIIEPPQNVHLTSYPNLGLLTEEYSIQDEATSAIRADDGIALKNLGIQYALSSPMSLLGANLIESKWWQILAEENGAKLWHLSNNSNLEQRGFASAPQQNDCIDECAWRPDPWKEHRWWNHAQLSDNRAFLSEGRVSWDIPLLENMQSKAGSIELFFDAPQGLELTFHVNGQFVKQDTNGGFETIRMDIGAFENHLIFTIETENGGSNWLNPRGLTERGAPLFDIDGVTIHYAEVRQADMMQAIN
jgi:hypothetical protein